LGLDKSVGDYAAAIVRDVDLLLADAGNLNAEQLDLVGAIKLLHGSLPLNQSNFVGTQHTASIA
jgi:hypothetical protein